MLIRPVLHGRSREAKHLGNLVKANQLLIWNHVINVTSMAGCLAPTTAINRPYAGRFLDFREKSWRTWLVAPAPVQAPPRHTAGLEFRRPRACARHSTRAGGALRALRGLGVSGRSTRRSRQERSFRATTRASTGTSSTIKDSYRPRRASICSPG